MQSFMCVCVYQCAHEYVCISAVRMSDARELMTHKKDDK